MIFRISETLIDYRTRQTGEKHKAVKTRDFDTQFNPSNPGMILRSFHSADPKPFIWPTLKSRQRPR
jgi:hypothetical protein